MVGGSITCRKEIDATGAQLSAKTYLFKPNSFEPIAFVENDGIYFYHLDHLGTPQEITNQNGELVWAVSYKAYGNLAVAFKAEVENNLRFAGQYFDEESGLHYNRFRYYDPACGRFINQDPIGLSGGVNNYLYVPNPTGWVDPLGLAAKPGDCTRTASPALKGDPYHPENVAKRQQEAKELYGPKPSSPGKMQKEVERGQAPPEIERVDKGHIPGQEAHVHFKDGTSSNQSGGIHDAHKGAPKPTKDGKSWLEEHGWTPPD